MSKISWQRWPPFVLYTNKRAKTQMSICKMENIFRCTLVKKRKGKKSLHALMTKRQRRGRRRGQPELEMNVAERGRKAINRPRLSEREGPFSPHVTDLLKIKNQQYEAATQHHMYGLNFFSPFLWRFDDRWSPFYSNFFLVFSCSAVIPSQFLLSN